MSEASLPLSTIAGRYRILRTLGKGSGGAVYLADDSLLHRKVAIKKLAAETSPQAVGIDRPGIGEARRAAALAHPRLAVLHDIVEDNGATYLIFEYIAGSSLRETMADFFELDEFLPAARDLVEAVLHAHDKGIVHCDLKPENVMIDETGRCKVLDFGLACLLIPSETQTLGTPPYLAPEVARNGAVDPRRDVYSLGVLFYELLTGLRPETTSGAVQVSQARSGMPDALVRLVAGMTEPDPDKRVQDLRLALEVLDTLGAVDRADGSGPNLETPLRPLPPETRGHGLRKWILMTMVSVLLVSTLALWAVSRKSTLPLPTNGVAAILRIEASGTEPGIDTEAFCLGLTEVLTNEVRNAFTPGPWQVQSFADIVAEGVETPADAGTRLGADLVFRANVDFGRERRTAHCEMWIVERSERVDGQVRTDRVPPEPILARSTSFPVDPTATHDLLSGLATTCANWLAGDGDVVDEIGSQLRSRLIDLENRFEERIAGAGTARFLLEGRGHIAGAESLDDLESAIEVLETARRTDARAAAVWASLARANREKARFLRREEATQAADDATRHAGVLSERAFLLDSLDAEVRFEAALAARSNGDTLRALEHFAYACSLQPAFDSAWFEFARTYGRRGSFEDEGRVYEQMVSQRSDARSHWWLADFYLKRGGFEDALLHYQSAVDLKPHSHDAHTNLGAVHLYLGHLDEARQAFRRSVSLSPSEQGLLNLGTVEFERKHFPAAAEAYQRAIQLGYGDAFAWINLGDVYYYGLADSVRARECYEQAVAIGDEELQRRPYDVRLWSHLSPVWARLNRPENASRYFEEAYSREPQNPEVLYCGALTHWLLDRSERATQLLGEALGRGLPRDWISRSPMFDDWQSNPRFTALLKEE